MYPAPSIGNVLDIAAAILEIAAAILDIAAAILNIAAAILDIAAAILDIAAAGSSLRNKNFLFIVRDNDCTHLRLYSPPVEPTFNFTHF